MTTHQILGTRQTQPLRLFATLLCSVFAAEAGVMLALPHLVPPNSSVSFTAVLDACVLTLGLSPLLWWLIVLPLRHLADARQRLLALVLSAQEDERRRISRDVHDGLGQTLTSLLVGLRTIEESSSDVALQASLRNLRAIGAGAHDEIRRLVRGLRPTVLDDAGLIPALERLLDDVRAAQGVDGDLKLDCIGPMRLSADVETALYRISQEAIANAIRHGAASRIDVAIRRRSNSVELSIRDNGCGFSPAKMMSKQTETSHFGLLSICERSRLLGGNAWIESKAGDGVTIRVLLPLARMDETDGKNSRSVG